MGKIYSKYVKVKGKYRGFTSRNKQEIAAAKKFAGKFGKFAKKRGKIIATNVRSEYGVKPYRLRSPSLKDLGF